MKKVYISPVAEIVASQMNQEVMAGHSQDWNDARGVNFDGDETEDENSEQTTIRNLWDE